MLDFTPLSGSSQSDSSIEIWKPILGYEGYYEVSDLGRVRRAASGRILKTSKSKRYPLVGLSINGVQKVIHVHRLVTAAFLGICPEGMEVNHKNGNKLDNRLSNLEYVSHDENMKHSVRQGLRGKYSDETVREVIQLLKLRKPHLNFTEISTRTGVDVYTVKSISGGKNRKATAMGFQPDKFKRPRKLDQEDIEKIKQLLSENRHTQRELANMFSVNESSISRIKRGNSNT